MRILVLLILSILVWKPSAAETRHPRDFRLPGEATAAFSHSEVVHEPGSAIVSMIGYINFDMYFELSKLRNSGANIRTIYIDSQGGEVGSALVLADLIHDLKAKLVVDGMCASSCAKFLFPAAVEKSVEPGSIVAIHAPARVIERNGKMELATGNEMDAGVFRDAVTTIFEPGWIERLKDAWYTLKARRLIDNFNRKYQTSMLLEKTFSDYLTRRKKFLGVDDVDSRPGSPACPRVIMWALSKVQLEAMGVRGIQDFWYPQGKDRAMVQDRAFEQVAGSIFFGDQRQVEMLCSGPVPRR